LKTDDRSLHRKNAAEWVMWAVLFPIAALMRWFRGLTDTQRSLLAVGAGCAIGGWVQGASLGRTFMALGLLLVALAVLGSDV
jgi:hypothetical protein